VALRISLEELRARPGRHAESEAHEAVTVLSDYPDLWDVKMDSSPTDCGASRFTPEGSHEPVIDFVKRVTDKPVVGVGRFTSPDTMLAQIRRGVLDLIGAARPSIADPFLPRKIAEGREDEIRECIGCNICISSWHDGVPVRCTQNPAAGEEWRRGWHPERIEGKGSDDRVLIVGGGPAGLECAQALGKRGYSVTLADAGTEWGGRLRFETRLPGLSAWRRVVDYRLGQLHRLPNVELFLESRLTAEDVLEQGCERVVLATGSRWETDLYSPMEVPSGRLDRQGVFTPSDLAEGASPEPPILVFDFDNYYLGGAVAEHLAKMAGAVIYATPAGHASAWTIMSNELPLVHQALAQRGVKVRTLCTLTAFDGETAALADLFTGAVDRLACRSVVMVGLRRPEDRLYHDLLARRPDWPDAGLRSVTRIGDALAPGAIVHAVHSGHLYARELDGLSSPVPYRFDQPLTSLN
jgi:dimethylamine/trimethylamine dehydrogenase